MKTFEQLKQISETYTKTATKVPCNAFALCNQLQVTYKVKFQYQEDYQDGYNLLDSVPALLCKNGNSKLQKYTIYFDENSHYWQFYIFHEIAHYILEHTTDDPEQEKEANLLACLLIAPPELIPTYFKNANDLSAFTDIPIGKAEEYWYYLHLGKHKPIKTTCIIGLFVLFTFGIIAFHFSKFPLETPADNNASNINNLYTTSSSAPSTTPYVVEDEDNETIYYITATGNKYHLPDCQYIKGKTNIKEITNPLQKGYQPCKRCIK